VVLGEDRSGLSRRPGKGPGATLTVIDSKVPDETGHVIDGIATPDLPAIARES
jgi:hypothetical protein